MEITEIRIKLMEEAGERLQAFCSITFDDSFVIRDLKVIEGANGPFVAMPSRKLTAHCPQCRAKNHLRAAYCNQCGLRLKEERLNREDGRAKLYADIAHPINSACRETIQRYVVEAYRHEIEQSKLPGYVCSYDDFDHDLTAGRMDEAGADPIGRSSPPSQAASNPERRSATAPRQGPAPRGPHRSPAREPAHASASASGEGFGAGIL